MPLESQQKRSSGNGSIRVVATRSFPGGLGTGQAAGGPGDFGLRHQIDQIPADALSALGDARARRETTKHGPWICIYIYIYVYMVWWIIMVYIYCVYICVCVPVCNQQKVCGCYRDIIWYNQPYGLDLLVIEQWLLKSFWWLDRGTWQSMSWESYSNVA